MVLLICVVLDCFLVCLVISVLGGVTCLRDGFACECGCELGLMCWVWMCFMVGGWIGVACCLLCVFVVFRCMLLCWFSGSGLVLLIV